MEHPRERLSKSLDTLDTRIALLPVGTFLRNRNIRRINDMLSLGYRAVRLPEAFPPATLDDLHTETERLSRALLRYINYRADHPFETLRQLNNMRIG